MDEETAVFPGTNKPTTKADFIVFVRAMYKLWVNLDWDDGPDYRAMYLRTVEANKWPAPFPQWAEEALAWQGKSLW